MRIDENNVYHCKQILKNLQAVNKFNNNKDNYKQLQIKEQAQTLN